MTAKELYTSIKNIIDLNCRDKIINLNCCDIEYPSIAALYVNIGRLKQKSYIEICGHKPSGLKGGKPKDLYHITNLGRDRFKESQAKYSTIFVVRDILKIGGLS